MDSALKDYLKKTPEEAIELIEKLTKSVANVGGLLMCVWHNSSITDAGEWENWKKVLNHTIKTAKRLK